MGVAENKDENTMLVPDEFCGIHFVAWLDVFLEYSLTLAKCNYMQAAYDIISSTLNANIFYHSPDSVFLIHVCWFCTYAIDLQRMNSAHFL